MGARCPRPAFRSVKHLPTHTGGAAEAYRIWADAARDVYYHGENPAFVLALLRPEARGYLAASLHQLGCAKCRALHGSIGGVSDDIELPDVLTPSGVNPHIKSTVYCARLGGVKHATCVKLMGYSITNKVAAGIHHSHELLIDDYLIMRIKEVSGRVVSNNRYASGAFAILPTGEHYSSTGALDYSLFDMHDGIVTHKMDPTWMKQLTLEITDRQGKAAHFGRMHLWFKLKVAHG